MINFSEEKTNLTALLSFYQGLLSEHRKISFFPALYLMFRYHIDAPILPGALAMCFRTVPISVVVIEYCTLLAIPLSLFIHTFFSHNKTARVEPITELLDIIHNIELNAPCKSMNEKIKLIDHSIRLIRDTDCCDKNTAHYRLLIRTLNSINKKLHDHQELHSVKRNARFIALGLRSNNSACFFSKLPTDLASSIAVFSGNQGDVQKDELKKVADDIIKASMRR